MTRLDELQANWDDAARRDAMWAILTTPGKDHGRWDAESFFESGRQEIENLLALLEAVDPPLCFGRALDFGCGIGRLAQALATRFEACDGVDISPAMIELARAHNNYRDRCHYHVTAADLALFSDDTFDLVYSSLVLQHIEAVYTPSYLREFVRVARPGGLIVFQLPSEPRRGNDDQGPHTSSAAPLPDRGFHATIDVTHGKLVGPPDTAMVVQVRVANRSEVTWPARGGSDGAGQINLGNHWYSEAGQVLAQDDSRACLPRDLVPGDVVLIDLPVNPPHSPGRYQLVLDMVQEGVTWFEHWGSATATVPVIIAPEEDADPQEAQRNVDGSWDPPCLEMHAVARDEVVEVLEGAGGRIVAVHDDHSAGPTWVSHKYVVTKHQPGRTRSPEQVARRRTTDSVVAQTYHRLEL